MRRLARRTIAWWTVIGTLAAVVVLLVGAFVQRMLYPPVTPFVEDAGEVKTVIQCEIVNASGVRGAGKRVLTYLRERGFDVVELSTSPVPQQQSSVLDRMGDRSSCVKVAKVLGIADSLVEPRIDSMLFVRASVVLGSDIAALAPFQE
ncbi:MAG: LytR family transcriptional regulator [Candidatus Kapabacteria bacterium]|nr:LytR family transcriptional regulator [Candidatus Kapabacteria bacterium]